MSLKTRSILLLLATTVAIDSSNKPGDSLVHTPVNGHSNELALGEKNPKFYRPNGELTLPDAFKVTMPNDADNLAYTKFTDFHTSSSGYNMARFPSPYYRQWHQQWRALYGPQVHWMIENDQIPLDDLEKASRPYYYGDNSSKWDNWQLFARVHRVHLRVAKNRLEACFTSSRRGSDKNVTQPFARISTTGVVKYERTDSKINKWQGLWRPTIRQASDYHTDVASNHQPPVDAPCWITLRPDESDPSGTTWISDAASDVRGQCPGVWELLGYRLIKDTISPGKYKIKLE